MKIVKQKDYDDGGSRVIIELGPDEHLIAVSKDRMYKLGAPCEDIVPGEVLSDAAEVCWCPVEQKWV